MSGPERDEDNDQDQPEHYVVTDVLDLHGFFPEQVAEVVTEFIRNALSLQLQRVQIIHGKGKSKMKYLVHKELERHAAVEEFGDAPPEMGGWGRTLVRLKKMARQV